MLPPSCRQREASVAIPSWSRSRSWISDATSGGSSCRTGLEQIVRWRSKRAASRGSPRTSASVSTATLTSAVSSSPSAASETMTLPT